MNSAHVTAILTESKGMQWLLAAIGIVLLIKVFRRDIVAAKCHFEGNAQSGSSGSMSMFAPSGGDVLEKAEEERKRLIVMKNRMDEEKGEPILLNFRRVANYS